MIEGVCVRRSNAQRGAVELVPGKKKKRQSAKWTCRQSDIVQSLNVGTAVKEKLYASDVALSGGAMQRREHAVHRLVVDRGTVIEEELGGLDEALSAAKDNRSVKRGEAVGLTVNT